MSGLSETTPLSTKSKKESAKKNMEEAKDKQIKQILMQTLWIWKILQSTSAT